MHGSGIEWTIKGGVPYHVPTLMREVKNMVATARVAKVAAMQDATAGRRNGAVV